MTVKTLITGCELYTCGRAVHGDLHSVGSTWVFNAVLKRNGEADWQYGVEHPNGFKQGAKVVIAIEGSFFERRGVIVIDHFSAELNDAAQDHISAAPL